MRPVARCWRCSLASLKDCPRAVLPNTSRWPRCPILPTTQAVTQPPPTGLLRVTICCRRLVELDSEEETQPDEAPLPVELEGKTIVEGTVRAPWRWERLLVESAVIGSEDRWERRIAGLERELRLRRKELSDEEEKPGCAT